MASIQKLVREKTDPVTDCKWESCVLDINIYFRYRDQIRLSSNILYWLQWVPLYLLVRPEQDITKLLRMTALQNATFTKWRSASHRYALTG
jgi:hypothetical protein